MSKTGSLNADAYGITQGFGEDVPYYKANLGTNGHPGTDFGAINREVFSEVAGNVQGTYPFDATAGSFIVIIDDAGNRWRYLHLQGFDVHAGQRVERGQQIAISDNTGLSKGPHIHLDYRPANYDVNNGFGGRTDPMAALSKYKEGVQSPEKEEMLNDGDSYNVTTIFGEGDHARFDKQAWSAVFYNYLAGKINQLKADKATDDGIAEERRQIIEAKEAEIAALKAQLAGEGDPDNIVITKKGFAAIWVALKSFFNKNN